VYHAYRVYQNRLPANYQPLLILTVTPPVHSVHLVYLVLSTFIKKERKKENGDGRYA